MKKLLTAVLTLAWLTPIATMSQQRTIELKVVETSDVHGHFFPYDFIEGRGLQGTLSRANTYINRLRAQYGNRLLLIDNGDILQGQPCVYWSNYVMPDDANLAARVINYMGYDAETVGNHDIETGHKVYDKWIREVRCPMLGANIVDTGNNLPYVHPYALIEREIAGDDPHAARTKVRIAIIGMITPTISCWLGEQLWQGLEFQEMVGCARRWVKYVQQVEHPDLILGLFHSGLSGGIVMENGLEENATERVAREVDGFDAIFFGHDHQLHNQTLKSPSGRDVLCIDPSCYVKNLAEATITLTYDGDKLVGKQVKGELIDVRNEEIDQQMVSHFQTDIDKVKAYVGRQIGTFVTEASTRDSYFGNSAFTDFIHQLQLQITGADISLNAPLSFDEKINKGPITVADMFKLYRFENLLTVMTMTGRELRGHLEMSYDLWTNTMSSASDHLLKLNANSRNDQQRMGFTNYTFNFDSAMGIDYEVDVTKPEGEKVRILGMSNGEPFDENKVYKVVMNSYRANGGGDLIVKGAGIPKDEIQSRIIYQSDKDLRYYLMQEIERMGKVTPRAGHNWKFVPEKWVKAAAKRDRQIIFNR
ncbi:MAG: bifunctional metallophosphatase/5'-nucleotidase [Prevotella sp.]|nr:bifunctional metallophosphatase/5'-nucleotidase [Prevotella sp.]